MEPFNIVASKTNLPVPGIIRVVSADEPEVEICIIDLECQQHWNEFEEAQKKLHIRTQDGKLHSYAFYFTTPHFSKHFKHLLNQCWLWWMDLNTRKK